MAADRDLVEAIESLTLQVSRVAYATETLVKQENEGLRQGGWECARCQSTLNYIHQNTCSVCQSPRPKR